MFIPGNQPKMLAKALNVRPDAYIPDMEDSVPDAEKSEARCIVRNNIAQLNATGIPVIPRVNARQTGLAVDDLTAIVGPGIYGFPSAK